MWMAERSRGRFVVEIKRFVSYSFGKIFWFSLMKWVLLLSSGLLLSFFGFFPNRFANPPRFEQLLYQDLEVETSQIPLDIKGKIPKWLEGTLVRNGPAKFTLGDSTVDHWFDGLAMLHAYYFDRGSVTYSNRFLRSDADRDLYDPVR